MDVPVLAYRGGRRAATRSAARACSSRRSGSPEVAELAHALAPDEAAARAACWPASERRLAGLRARRACEARCARTWSRCDASAPALAFVVQRYGAGRHRRLASRWRARWRSAWPREYRDHRLHDLRARLRHLAQRAARRAGARSGGVDGAALPGRGGARPRRVQPLLRDAVRPCRTPTTTSSSGCGGRAPTCRSWSRRCGARRTRFAAVVFFTYLYYPTYWGLALPEAADRAVLVPTTHDEPPLRFSIYREVFVRPRAFAFLTRGRGGPGPAPLRARGPPDRRSPAWAWTSRRTPDVDAFRLATRRSTRALRALRRPHRRRQGLRARCWRTTSATAREKKDALDLRADRPAGDAGAAACKASATWASFPRTRSAAALAGARVVVCPSPYESLSIALLEGLSLGTPGLVNARSEVLKEHCLRSGAALYYEDADEFVESMDLVARDGSLRRRSARAAAATCRPSTAGTSCSTAGAS